MKCGTCNGTGTVTTDTCAHKCWTCKGTGIVPASLN